jgi:hypothetical protein
VSAGLEEGTYVLFISYDNSTLERYSDGDTFEELEDAVKDLPSSVQAYAIMRVEDTGHPPEGEN